MFLTYLFLNFEKVVKRLLFLIVYFYLSSFAFCIVHDGIKAILVYKNPVDLYTRTYQLLKWYYYNRDALSTGRVIKFVSLIIATYGLQSWIWGIHWGEVKRKIFEGVFFLLKKSSTTLAKGSFARFKDFDDDIEKIEKNNEDEALLDSIKAHVNEGISEVLEKGYGEITSSEIVSKIKKLTIEKIDYELELFIRRAVLEHLHNMHDNKSRKSEK